MLKLNSNVSLSIAIALMLCAAAPSTANANNKVSFFKDGGCAAGFSGAALFVPIVIGLVKLYRVWTGDDFTKPELQVLMPYTFALNSIVPYGLFKLNNYLIRSDQKRHYLKTGGLAAASSGMITNFIFFLILPHPANIFIPALLGFAASYGAFKLNNHFVKYDEQASENPAASADATSEHSSQSTEVPGDINPASQ